MPKTIVKDIKLAFSQRIKSPIIMSYILAGCSYHYPLVLKLMFSNDSIEKKITYIEAGLKEEYSLVAPVGIVLLLLFLVPILNYGINFFNTKVIRFRELDLKAEDEAKSIKRANDLEKVRVDAELTIKKRTLDEANSEASELKSSLDIKKAELKTGKFELDQVKSNKQEADDEFKASQNKLEASREELRSLKERIKPLSTSLNNKELSLITLETKLDEGEKKIEEMKEEYRNSLAEKNKMISEFNSMTENKQKEMQLLSRETGKLEYLHEEKTRELKELTEKIKVAESQLKHTIEKTQNTMSL